MNYWQGKKIRLRAIEPGDAETFYQWNQDSQRNANLDFIWPPTSLASVQAWAASEAQRKFENDAFRWVIEDLHGTPVGSIDTHHVSPHDGVFSYGVDVAAAYRRQGYAREAIWMVLRYYFEELRYQKVNVVVHSDNPDSIQLHEALGFQLEGRLRRSWYHGGHYVDALWYGLTYEEFSLQVKAATGE